MAFEDLLRLRLYSQRLADGKFASAVDVVRWFGAVQSQDFNGAAWAVSQRLPHGTLASFCESFARGEILRTHVLRPTWHFVAAEDIRWMLDLARPQLTRLSAPYWRKFELDEAFFERSNRIIVAALERSGELTRTELANELRQNGIDIGDTVRLSFIVGRAELDALICSGGVRGKQQTYALLERRAPQAKTLPREAALAQLATRFFQSHGPATLKDFAWWSGLSVKDASAGLHDAREHLMNTEVNDKTYWLTPDAREQTAKEEDDAVHLLANYDEYTVAYADRSMIFDNVHLPKLDSRQNALFTNVVLAQGRIVGTWKRTLVTKNVAIEVKLFEKLTDVEMISLQTEAGRFGVFLDLPMTLHTAQV